MKRTIIIVIILLAAAGLIFFSTMWPLEDNKSLSGTLAGVKKAEKYRGDQPEREDLMLSEDKLTTLTQSAEWQNAMKNEELVKFLQSDDFQKFYLFQNDMQKIYVANCCYDAVKSFSETGNEIDIDKLDFGFPSNDFNGMVICFAREFYKLLQGRPGSTFMTFDEAMKLLYTSSDMNMALAFMSNDMQQLVLSQEFEQLINSQQYQDMNKWLIVFSTEFQKVLGPNLINLLTTPQAQDIQSALYILSNDFQKYVYSQEFNKIFFINNSEFQNISPSNDKDFQKAIFSQDFQNLMHNDIMNTLGVFSNGFQMVKNAAAF